jgi:hypothetical protein
MSGPWWWCMLPTVQAHAAQTPLHPAISIQQRRRTRSNAMQKCHALLHPLGIHHTRTTSSRDGTAQRPLAFAPPLWDTVSSIAVSDASSINPVAVWSLRIASALVTYGGLVTWLDRPRGRLCVSLSSIEVRPSSVPNAGLGVWTTQDLPAGTILGTYPGVVVPLQQHTSKLRLYPQCEGYIWRFSDNQYVLDPTNATGDITEMCSGGNPSTPLSLVLWQLWTTIGLFQGVPTTLCRINEPPRGRDVQVITQENLVDRTVTMILERDAMAGEELYMDYGLYYDRSRYGGGVS